ncbi:uncharacterized protein DUF397 [Herbihabitans rhizosphaerae]|uniref:Uncharacterized protein DUF397 n=1 Tax=Herbihabitans rhizosphaerae TaxID=1872711 RepID=A0A4Q7L4J0_9PSEU|nr:DUF397 domain-containing protein [Herbihabitans rhizosphaerae]RZS43700.1 uncharacterized protein DUF397 [Herbihabitans rhizosphaerae]
MSTSTLDVRWRRSSYSQGDATSSNCVEVAHPGAAVSVRDSKNADGEIISVSPRAWARLMRQLG